MSDLLLVDNDRRIVELVAFFLEKRGHVVRRAESYRAARAELRARRPELMLADLELGSERGAEELPSLARDGLLPPTLIVSGYLDAETERRLCALPGVLGALRKPFDLLQLEVRIAQALAASARLDAKARDARPEGARGLEVDDNGWIDVKPHGAIL